MDRRVAALLAMTDLCSEWLSRRFDDFSLAYEEPRLPLPPRGFSKKANVYTLSICKSLQPRGLGKKAAIS